MIEIQESLAPYGSELAPYPALARSSERADQPDKLRSCSGVALPETATARPTASLEGQRRDGLALPRAIIYCRVSTPRQRRATRSLAAQAELGTRFALAHGYTVGRVTEEIASGAALWDRPLLMPDRAALRAGEFQALIVTDLDRLSRNPVHLALIAESCARAGVALLVVNELLPTPQQLLAPGGPGMRAWLEREQLRSRMVGGKRNRALAGLIHGAGMELYGYRRDKQAGVREIYEPEAAVVRQIFQWVVDEGVTLGEVVRRLHAAGVVSPSAGKINYDDAGRTPRWARGQLHRILTEPSYQGTAVAWRWESGKDGSMPTERPRDERIVLPEHVTPALVTAEVWQAAQRIVTDNQRAAAERQATAQRALLTSLIRCAVCGLRMDADRHTHGVFYRCSSRQTARGKCGASLVHAADCERWVWSEMAGLLDTPAKLLATLPEAAGNASEGVLRADRAVLDGFLVDNERRHEQLADCQREHAGDGLTQGLIGRELGDVTVVAAQLQVAMDELVERLRSVQSPRTRVEHLLAELSMRELDQPWSFDQQRAILEALEVQVVANGRSWQLRFCTTANDDMVAET